MTKRNDLLSNNILLQQVVENSEAATLIIDRTGKIILVNARFTQLSGYAAEELECKVGWKDVFNTGNSESIIHYLQLLRANPTEVTERIEISFKDKQGTNRSGYLRGFQLTDSEHQVLYVVDITDQKEHEKELEHAKEAAENSERLKTEFLANMSHEIRTPINSIVGFADLLKIEGISEEQKNLYLSQVINGSTDLMLLIEKIITIARLDSGQLKIHNRSFPINQRMKELEEKFRSELLNMGKEHIELNFQAPDKEQNLEISADPLRLIEVISNLLENAVKFTSEGRIEFGYYYLDEENEGSDESLLFFVKDSGSGIEKSKKSIIFDRFVKIIDKEETIFRGSGLGLSIARELVTLFGGNIWVESTKGDGSRFFFTYPLTKNKIKKPEIPLLVKAEKTSIDWSDKEILIAEDVESNYLYIKELLSPTKVKFLRARDGIEAVDIFEQNPSIDAVLMDILMPGKDGYEATQDIRKIRADIPVIAQTAFTFEGDIRDGLYAGCFNDYIMKPYSRKVLFAILKKHFDQ